jgi:uncharacterized protein YecT (DUF1311 family)
VNGESFTLLAADESYKASSLPQGFVQIHGKKVLSCSLGIAKVKAIVRVYPPSAHGMGMGSGYASIDRLAVNDLPLFGYPRAFNWEIPGSERALVKVAISIKRQIPVVEVCDTERCSEQSLGSDSALNYNYQRAMAALSEPDRQQLRQEQQFWLRERDPQCQLAILDKRNEPLAFLQCVESATNIRAIRLQQQQRKRRKS